jgi:hypothetical protein
MAVRFSALRAARPLSPGGFPVLISDKGWVDPQGHSAAGRIRSIENSVGIVRLRITGHGVCIFVFFVFPYIIRVPVSS